MASRMTEQDRARIKTLKAQMEAAGCADASDWATSEVSENIPQFGRFLILRDIHDALDVERCLEDLRFEDPASAAVLEKLQKVLDADELHDFLYAYGKVIGSGLVAVLDEGPQDEGVPGWALMELTPDCELTGRVIQGLHENFPDFEDSLTRK